MKIVERKRIHRNGNDIPFLLNKLNRINVKCRLTMLSFVVEGF